jgi:hypothetical protein
MDLTGSTYLYALAQLSMAFVAFSTIVIVVRSALGETISKSHLLLTRLYIELGLAATGFSMLPMLLTDFGWPHDTVWRVSGAMASVTGAYWMLIYPWRHHAATSRPMPGFVYVEYLIGWAVTLYGAANAIGYPIEPYAAPYLLMTTWTLVLASAMFLLTMHVFLRPEAEKDK